ncbi:MAG: OmpA family protein [Steroidobacteraceae bacterium]
MNNAMNSKTVGSGLVAAAVASVLAACASTPMRPTGAVDARARLTQLQSDPALANRAPLAMQSAEDAVRVSEQPGASSRLEAYRVYIANRDIDIARAQAETRLAEDQRPELRAENDKVRLDARTRELDRARNETARANSAGADQAMAAASAREDADAANMVAATAQQQASDARSERDDADLAASSSRQQSAELQRQIDLLQPTVSGSGLVVTLGDSMFSRNGTMLEDRSSGGLERLVAFLDRYPNRTASIRGYTDNTGTEDGDQARSERSADSVMSYLVAQGIAPDRLTASGMGDRSPVATNASVSGRQMNRRVEVTIHASGQSARRDP